MSSFRFVINIPNDDTVVSMRVYEEYRYSFKVNWGDECFGSYTYRNKSRNIIHHTFEKAGEYTIVMSGRIGKIRAEETLFKYITEVIDLGDCKWQDLSFMFAECNNMVRFKGGITSDVKSMDHMFTDCKKLSFLDISSFDTYNVTNMRGMFTGLSKLSHIDVSHFNTFNVTDMSHMFRGMKSLRHLSISNFRFKGPVNMGLSFDDLNSCEVLDLRHLDFSKIDLYLINDVRSYQNCFKYGPKKVIVKLEDFCKYFKGNPRVYGLVEDRRKNSWLNSLDIEDFK
jgi:surface protein